MELLSPAGNLELALAAFDGGADAVYCGLAGAFNARMRAENFTLETLGKLIRFANENGKRVYVTFNTLIKENELGTMFENLSELAKLRPDALIVQDAGVIYTVRKYFPELKLHASTQMGIHNSAGVKVMENLGISRVILERQITLPELKKISENSNIELEVFIHGSLCCSLSGRCLLSGHLFNQSGNRGQCKQPCRRSYTANGQSGFFLSPGDLCGLSILDELRSANVASLKIEGRLRTPDYVWKTARAYRTLLDAPAENSAEAYIEAENILNTALSRRKTLGFYDFPSTTALIDYKTPGSFGIPAAVVEKSTRRGILVKTTSQLHLGDRLRLTPPTGGDGETFSLISMEIAPNQKVLKVRPHSRIFIPGKFNAKAGFVLTKIGENGFDFSRQAANLPNLRYPLDMEIDFSAARFSISLNGHTVEYPCAFAPAEKHPLQKEAVQKCFSEAMPEPWCAGNITVNIDGNFFVPAAELKKIRREFWFLFHDKLNLDELLTVDPGKMEDFFCETSATPAISEVNIPANSFSIPGFIGENELASYQQKISAAYRSGIRHFKIAHWHGFELLKNYDDITISAEFPIPVCNSRCAALLHSLKVSSAISAPELDTPDMNSLQQHSPVAITSTQAPVPLLVSRIPLKNGKWLDRDGNSYTIVTRNGISELYAD